MFFRRRMAGAVTTATRLAIAGTVVAGLAISPATASTPSPIISPRLSWHTCPGQDNPPGYQCSSVAVPVDWSQPAGRKINLTVARLPSTDPAHTIGSVLFNSGGPGAPSVDDLKLSVDKVTELRTRFNVVTWNPRGAFTTWSESQRAACEQSGPPLTVPASQAEYDATAKANQAIEDKCRQQDPQLFDHMDSESHARDLDAIRQALGESSLNYFGQSYGGVIGVAYAQLFPQRVRTMFLDSIVDHTATGAHYDELEGSAREALFGRFVDWCRTTTSCTLYGRDVRAAWRALVERAELSPIPVLGAQPSLNYNGADLEMGIQPFLSVGRFAELDKALDHAQHGDAAALAAPARGVKPWAANLYTATNCADGFSYPTYPEYRQAVARGRRNAPDFPRAAAGLFSPCIGWPTPFANPRRLLRTPGLAPVLEVAGINEINNVRDVAAQLPRSSVISVPGIYHGLYMAAGNRCVITLADRYFIDRTLPPVETVCPANG